MICELYPDKGGKWRFRFRAKNGRIVAASGESFVSKSNALRAAKAFEWQFTFTPVKFVDLRASGKERK